MRLIIDSTQTRVEFTNIVEINDNGCDLELYADTTGKHPIEMLIGGYWSIVYGYQLTIEKSHIQMIDDIYLVPDEEAKDNEANN